MSSPFAYEAPATAVSAVAERTFLRQVFAWMLLGLALTTGVAIYLASSNDVAQYFADHSGAYWVLIIVQFGAVIALTAALPRISANTAALLFCLYAGLTSRLRDPVRGLHDRQHRVRVRRRDRRVRRHGALRVRDQARPVELGRDPLRRPDRPDRRERRVHLRRRLDLQPRPRHLRRDHLRRPHGVRHAEDQGDRREGSPMAGRAELAIFGALALYLDFINLFLSLLRIFGSRS
jgi:hypothetical protein